MLPISTTSSSGVSPDTSPHAGGRDQVIWISPDPAENVGLQAHEKVIPERVQFLVAAFAASGAQSTPVMLFAGDDAILRIGDGHHRVAAAQRLAQQVGRRVQLAAVVFSSPASGHQILPAHRVLPRGVVDGLGRRLEAFGYARVVGDAASQGSSQLVLGCDQWRVTYARAGATAAETMGALWAAWPLVDATMNWWIVGDAEEALHACSKDTGFVLVPAVEPETVAHAWSTGQLLPPRSTNFQPKLRVGSVQQRLGL